MKKRKGTIHSVDPVLFQRYLNSQPDHVLATLISEFGFKPSMMFKSSALWKHYIKWQKTDNTIIEFPTLEKRLKDEFGERPAEVENYDNLSDEAKTILSYDKIPDTYKNDINELKDPTK